MRPEICDDSVEVVSLSISGDFQKSSGLIHADLRYIGISGWSQNGRWLPFGLGDVLGYTDGDSK